MAAIQITKATLSDLSLIKDISIQTFAETFAPVNSVQNIDRYIDENLNEIILRNELQNRSSAFYLAKVNDKVVGYLKLNWGAAQTETLADEALEIQRIYVLQEYQGQQIGQHLLLQAIEIAKNKKIKNIWLGVWEKNHKALRFYKKNGFVAFDTHVFRLGTESQTDLLVRLELNKEKQVK